MSKTLTVYPERCNSCRICELTCSFKHEGTFNPALSRVQVSMFAEQAAFVPITCNQCSEAWCQKACPSRAIQRNLETGVVAVKEERCVGCRMCTSACPFGVIAVNPATEKATKCDLCDGAPECALSCPTGALAFEEASSPLRLKRELTAKQLLLSTKEV